MYAVVIQFIMPQTVKSMMTDNMHGLLRALGALQIFDIVVFLIYAGRFNRMFTFSSILIHTITPSCLLYI